MWWDKVKSIQDIYNLVEFEKQVQPEQDCLNVSEYIKWLNSGLEIIILKESKNKWKGSYQLLPKKEGTIIFAGFGRHPDYKGRGIGQILMNRLIATHPNSSLLCETRQDNKNMIRLLKSNGFEFVKDELKAYDHWTWWEYNHKSKDFPLFTRDSTFTDDTVCSVAIADCLMNDPRMDFASYLRAYCNQVPHAGYGGMFKQWLQDETMGPYNSWGNGGAMRVSSVYFLEASSLNNLYEVVRATCYPTHNHEDAVSGATAIVIAMYLSSINCHIEEIRSALSEDFEYDS